MQEKHLCRVAAALAVVLIAAPVGADVFYMSDGMTSLETVWIGNPGNGADANGLGGVDYEYAIGKYEVTAGQYAEFLNAVAATDAYGLYTPMMWVSGHPSGDFACKIERSGAAGGYTYNVAEDWADRPVNFVSWGDAARFANWLHNGQPTGEQDLSTTEDGAYFLNGATTTAELMAVTRESDWLWAIPTSDEWYKAAYHKNDGTTANYYLYPTGTDNASTLNNAVTDPDRGNNMNVFDGNWLSDDGWAIGAPYYRTEVGEYGLSASPYGTFDQGGNVSEWTEAVTGTGGRRMSTANYHWVSAYLNPGKGTLGTSSADPSLIGASSPTWQDCGSGFRVVGRVAPVGVIPEPASALVWLGLGMIGVAAIRRRTRDRRES